MNRLEEILAREYLSQMEKEEEEKLKKGNLKPVYCTQSVGESLYSDKLAAISKYENISFLLRQYINNTRVDEDVIKDLKKAIKDGKILDLKQVTDLGYDKEYLEVLDSLDTMEENGLYITNGLTEQGYIETTNLSKVSIDLKVFYGISIIMKDIKNKILVEGRKPKKILSFRESDYLNDISFMEDDVVLQIGTDLGYLKYRARNVKTIDIYDEDEKTLNYLLKNVYPKVSNNIINKVSLEDLDLNKYTKIVISPILDEDLQMKYFYDLKLYNHFENIYTPQKHIILNKFKLDFQDIVMTDREQVEDSIIEGMKDMKGMGQLVAATQLSFLDKSEAYLKENKLFFDSYKNWQRFIRRDENILNILKSGD